MHLRDHFVNKVSSLLPHLPADLLPHETEALPTGGGDGVPDSVAGDHQGGVAGRDRGGADYEVTGRDRGGPDCQAAPDGGELGLESVAQGAGEGGRAEVGVVEAEDLEVGAGDLQGGTLDWHTDRGTVLAPAP